MSRAPLLVATLAIALVVLLLVRGTAERAGESRVQPIEALEQDEIDPFAPALPEVRRATAGAPRATPTEPPAIAAVFDLEEAQEFGRPMAMLHPHYRDDILEIALRWPDGVSAGPRHVPNPESPALNPQKLELDELEVEQFEDEVRRFNAELEVLGAKAFDLVAEATEHYYDSIQGPGWMPEEDLAGVERRESIGHWNRSLVVKHSGYIRRIDFDTGDYDHVEDHFDVIDLLRDERFAAAKAFIERHGE